MGIAFDGPNRRIILSTDLVFSVSDVKHAHDAWYCLHDNMQYPAFISAAGKAPFGGGIYSDITYTLLNGAKFTTDSSYSEGALIQIIGTIVTDDGSLRNTTPAELVGDVNWEYQVATAGVVVSGGGGGPSANDIAAAVWANSSGSMALSFLRYILSK